MQPILDGVNIPWLDLRARVLELPPKSELVIVPGVGGSALEAAQVLQSMGRACRICDDFQFGGDSCVGRLWKPNPLLEASVQDKPGTALDLGCGSGRDSVFLASAGWQVDAVDRLPDALERVQALARRSLIDASNIRVLQADLRKPFTFPQAAYDLIICFFMPRLAVMTALPDLIAPGGMVLVEGFTKTHQEKFGKPKGDQVLDFDQLRQAFANAAKLEYAESWHEGRHTGRLLISGLNGSFMRQIDKSDP